MGDGQKNQTSQTFQDDQARSGGQTSQTPSNSPLVPTSATPPKLKEQGSFAGAQGKPPDVLAGINVAEADKVAKEEGDEYWENYAREIELEKEIMEMGGVEKVESGEVKVPEDVAKEMGIKPTVNIQTPIAGATNFSIRGVALSDDQLMVGLSKPTSTGWRWLVEWFIYQLRKAHYQIKKVGGKLLRFKVNSLHSVTTTT